MYFLVAGIPLNAYDLELTSPKVAPGNMFPSYRVHLQLKISGTRREETMRTAKKRNLAETRICGTDGEMPGSRYERPTGRYSSAV